MPTPSTNSDWTGGPAKWAAVVVLGGASLAGMAWSIFGREPRPMLVPRDDGAAVEMRHGAIEPPGTAVPRDDRAVTVLPADKPAAADAGAPESNPDQPPASSEAGATSLGSRPINLNTATAAELELLPGIGPALAARIVEHRKANGLFKSVNELDHVRGIGPRTMDALRPLVTVK